METFLEWQNNWLDNVRKTCNKKLVEYLRQKNIDERQIYTILCDTHGLCFKKKASKSHCKKKKALEYAKRNITNLINSDVITLEEKDLFSSTKARLEKQLSFFKSEKIKGKTEKFIVVPMGNLGVHAAQDIDDFPARGQINITEKSAISENQAIGRQVVDLFNYISNFDKEKKYSQKKIFNLIADLFEGSFGFIYSETQIKTFYNHNKNFINQIK